MNLQTILIIGSGGFIGAVLRAYSIGVVNRHIPHLIPFGTLFVNLFGSFIMGLLFAIFENSQISPNVKSLLTTGFLGAFTTYSTFAIESLWLFKSSYSLAILNVLLNAFGSILFAYFGYKLILWSYN